MVKKANQIPKLNRHRTEVMLGIWTDRKLRTHGQAAVKILGYGDMTKFIEAKLQEAIEQAGIKITADAI